MSFSTVSHVPRRQTCTPPRWGWLVVVLTLATLTLTLPTGFSQRLAARVTTLCLLVVFVQTALGLGGRWLARPWGSLAATMLAFAMGWCGLSLPLVLLAVLHLYGPVVIVPLALAAWMIWGLGCDGRLSGCEVWNRLNVWKLWRFTQRTPGLRLVYAAWLGLIVFAGLWALGPVWDVDSEMYLLPNAQFFLKHHGLVSDPLERLRNSPSLMSLWYGVGLSLGCEGFAAGLMWVAGVATSLLAAGWAAREFGTRAALWTVPIYWSGMIVLAVASTPRVEPAYALFILAGWVRVTEGLRAGRLGWSMIWQAGLLLGTAASIKYQGLYGWVILAGWWGCHWLADRRLRTWSQLAAISAVFLIAIAVVSPWWIKNIVTFGNPLYPMFAAVDPESLRNANPHGPHRHLPWNYLALDLWDFFYRPNSFSGPPHHYPHYLFLLLPVLVWGVWQRWRSATRALQLALAGLAYFALSDTLAREIRHMFPLFALWSVATAYVLSEIELRFRWQRLVPGAVTFFLAFSLFFPVRWIAFPPLLPYLAGITDEKPLLDRITPGLHRIESWCNAHTPPNATVLMCWETRGYRLRRDVITDPGRATWRTLFRHDRQPDEIAAFLQAQGVDYVLINTRALWHDVERARLLPPETLPLFRSQRKLLVPRVLEKVSAESDITLYRVRKPQELSAKTAD